MSTKTTSSKTSYIRHSAEYNLESLKLATQIGCSQGRQATGLT